MTDLIEWPAAGDGVTCPVCSKVVEVENKKLKKHNLSSTKQCAGTGFTARPVP